MPIKLPVGNGRPDFEMPLIESDITKSNWITVNIDQYKPDKDKFIIEKFYKDFPHLKDKAKTVDHVYRLASRNVGINKWLQMANVDYAQDTVAPLWVKPFVTPTEYDQLINKVTSLNNNNKNRAEELASAADEYKRKVDNINKNYDNLQNSLLAEADDAKLAIITLPSIKLPASIGLAIDNYTPLKDSPNKQMYAREMLLQYKTKLLKYVHDNKLTKNETYKLIEDLSSK